MTKFGDNRTWIGARKLFTNIPVHIPVYLPTHWCRRKHNLPSPSVGEVMIYLCIHFMCRYFIDRSSFGLVIIGSVQQNDVVS